MDPNQTWRDLSAAITEAERERGELADGLLHWLKRDGFPPEITGHRAFDRIVARAACEAIAVWEVC